MFESIFEKLRLKPAEIPLEKRPALILQPQQQYSDFNPDPYEDCFCGSDKIFIKCCGSPREKRPPPYGITVLKNYISMIEIQSWREIADRCHGERIKVIHHSSTVNNLHLVEDDRRISELVELEEHQNRINKLVGTLYSDLALEYYGRTLDWYERPQLLRYREGGLYVKHADSDNFDSVTRTWNKTIDRDLSLLIYLNDDFSGGDLFFEKFNYRLKPKAGMVVMFPSDHRYIHEAETITIGTRYAFVSWASVKGINKVMDSPPASAILVNQVMPEISA